MAYTSVATDSFTGTAQAVLDANWAYVRDTSFGSTIRYSDPTGRAVGRYSSGGTAGDLIHNCVYVRASGTYAQDQYASVVTGGLSANWGFAYKLGVGLRCTTATNNSSVGYYAFVTGEAAGDVHTVRIVKTDGTEDGTTLYTGASSIDWQDGDVFLFEAVGSASTVLTCYRAAAGTPTTFVAIPSATATDSSSPITTANRPAIFLAGDDIVSAGSELVWISAWEGGDVTSGGGPVTVAASGSALTPGTGTAAPVFLIGL
jgi:hypothetical protein